MLRIPLCIQWYAQRTLQCCHIFIRQTFRTGLQTPPSHSQNVARQTFQVLKTWKVCMSHVSRLTAAPQTLAYKDERSGAGTMHAFFYLSWL